MSLKVSLIGNGWILFALSMLIVLILVSCNKYYIKKGQIISPSSEILYGEYVKQSYRIGSSLLNFNIIYPENFDEGKKYPVLFFLHGAGERGNDNESQLTHGGDLIKAGANKHGVIAILPQCPTDEYWIEVLNTKDRPDGVRNFDPDVKHRPAPPLLRVMGLIKTFLDYEFVDKSRIYIAGLSMGGMGTFDLCWRMPDTFAAASAVCGAGSPKKASDFSELPMRIYHGEEDRIVSVDESIEMIDALKAAGGNPEVFLYPDVYHNSWDNAFAEPDFLTWMFKHRKQ